MYVEALFPMMWEKCFWKICGANNSFPLWTMCQLTSLIQPALRAVFGGMCEIGKTDVGKERASNTKGHMANTGMHYNLD